MKRRDFLIGGTLAGAMIASRRIAAMDAAGAGDFDAIVDAAGHGSHRTLAAALAAAPADGARPFRILLARGQWREKLVIDKPNISLVGADRAGSVLVHGTAAGHRRDDGEPWGTWGCATLIVRAADFSASSLTIANDFDYVGNLGSAAFQPIGANGLQAVALMLATGADRCDIAQVTLQGHQDTLFVDAGRARFRDCLVTGSVDFVFGAGRALFERCELRSRWRPDKPRQGYVAVPSTPATQDCGLVFAECRLTREARVPDASVALGRAWRPGRTFADGHYGDPAAVGNAVFLASWMDAHIDPVDGWDPMSYSARDGQRVSLAPGDARLFEHASVGPGAARSPNRRWLDAEQAAAYAPARVLAGWNPTP
jgi:pectinesterase